MGWFGNSEKSTNSDSSEICANTGVRIDSEYTYYLGEDGNVWRKNDIHTELVAMAGVSKVDEYLYYIDTNGGNVCRIHKSGDFGNLDEAEINSIDETNPPQYSGQEVKQMLRDKVILRAKKREEYYDYDEAIEIYEENNMPEEAARVRKLKVEQGAVKVEQTVIHGDQVTKTEIKDSVLNKSNIGAGGKSKAEEIKEIKELHDTGAIDDDEFKQMKKEILGK